MKKIALVLLIPMVYYLISCSINKKQDNFSLVWSDEFNYTGLPDSTKWSYDIEGNAWGWGNNEAQFYTRARKENAWVENGLLHITARKNNFEDHQYTSG